MLGANQIRDKVKKTIEKRMMAIKELIKKSNIPDNSTLCVRDIEIKREYVFVRLKGVCDVSTIPEAVARTKYHPQVDKHVVIDFKEVGHIDSSMLAVLVNLFVQLKDKDKKLVIINATEELIGYIDILRLRPIIKVLSDDKEAIRFLDTI